MSPAARVASLGPYRSASMPASANGNAVALAYKVAVLVTLFADRVPWRYTVEGPLSPPLVYFWSFWHLISPSPGQDQTAAGAALITESPTASAAAHPTATRAGRSERRELRGREPPGLGDRPPTGGVSRSATPRTCPFGARASTRACTNTHPRGRKRSRRSTAARAGWPSPPPAWMSAACGTGRRACRRVAASGAHVAGVLLASCGTG